MSVSDDDLELLETWLDGELPDELAETLRRRLGVELALAEAMDQLRFERQARSRVWQTLEPADEQVEALIGNVRRSVRRDEVWGLRLRSLRNISAVAASIVLVFAAGWLSHGRAVVEQQAPGSAQLAQDTSPRQRLPISMILSNPAGQVVFPPDSRTNPGFGMTPEVRSSIPGGALVSFPGNGARPAPYQVQVLDRFGNIISAQPLDSIEDARRFTDEMGRWQARHQPSRGSGDALLVNQPSP